MAEARRVANRAGDVVLREGHCFVKRLAEREVRSERRGKRASGSVRVPALDARGAILDETVPVIHEIDDVRAREVAALEDDGRRAKLQHPPRGLTPIFVAADRHPGECLRFRKVRCHDERTA